MKHLLFAISCIINCLFFFNSQIATTPQQQIDSSDIFKKLKNTVKDWTVITYMAADNDLAPFARKNLKQQMDVGSNQLVNIVTQLDTRITGNIKITKRYYVEQNKLLSFTENGASLPAMDSGSPETLIDCFKWAVENFPAHNYAAILWNHATGIIDIGRPKSISPLQLFIYNPTTQLIDLDRSIPFLDFIQSQNNQDRGICFDDTTGHYLTNQGLEKALHTISSTILKGSKIKCICFDACLMAMLEVANIVRNYADFMIASQEVELGSGHHYQKMLEPFLEKSMNPLAFANHIVSAYGEVYSTITNDYTQSSINLRKIQMLESNVNTVAKLLIEAIGIQKLNSVKDAIKASRHKLVCTHFDEPSYIDLYHFYQNILQNLKNFYYQDARQGAFLTNTLSTYIKEGLKLISDCITANVVGKNLSKAHGISIYFPEKNIHNSYKNTLFAQTNTWHTFLRTYLQK